MLHIYSIRTTRRQLRLEYRDFETGRTTVTYHPMISKAATAVHRLLRSVPHEKHVYRDCIRYYLAADIKSARAEFDMKSYAPLNDEFFLYERREISRSRVLSNYEIEFHEFWRKEVRK